MAERLSGFDRNRRGSRLGRLTPAIVAATVLAATGCYCRPGMIDCTTGRAYPAFCKPLSGGCDPSTWFCDNCPCACASYQCGAFTPYGGTLPHGEPMRFVPACAGPPLAYSPAAVPARPEQAVPGVPFSGGYIPVPAPWPPLPGYPVPGCPPPGLTAPHAAAPVVPPAPAE